MSMLVALKFVRTAVQKRTVALLCCSCCWGSSGTLAAAVLLLLPTPFVRRPAVSVFVRHTIIAVYQQDPHPVPPLEPRVLDERV